MPVVKDPVVVRALLETDRPWAVYALGDLATEQWDKCTWHAGHGPEPALLLLYRAFATPILIAVGTPSAVRPLLDELRDVPAFYVHIRPEIADLVRQRWPIHDEKMMLRMTLALDDFRPEPAANAIRLTASDVPALERLYADGAEAGEVPHFFSPSMVENGVFYGTFEGIELAAVAGTHLVVETESVGAIGNVYTRRDRRGHGMAGRLTSAVAGELLGRGIRTVALNVHEENRPAICVYKRLGFRQYCVFREGLAMKNEGTLQS